MQGLGKLSGLTGQRVFSRKLKNADPVVSAATSSPATDASNNVLGEAIRKTYGTVHWADALPMGASLCQLTCLVRRDWFRPDYTMGVAEEQSHPTTSKGSLTLSATMLPSMG